MAKACRILGTRNCCVRVRVCVCVCVCVYARVRGMEDNLNVLHCLTYGRMDMPWAIEKQWENTRVKLKGWCNLIYTLSTRSAHGKVFLVRVRVILLPAASRRYIEPKKVLIIDVIYLLTNDVATKKKWYTVFLKISYALQYIFIRLSMCVCE